MWVWEVDEVVPITCFIIKPLGVTFTLCLLRHAMLVDVVGFECIHDTCEMLINGLLKVAT